MNSRAVCQTHWHLPALSGEMDVDGLFVESDKVRVLTVSAFDYTLAVTPAHITSTRTPPAAEASARSLVSSGASRASARARYAAS